MNALAFKLLSRNGIDVFGSAVLQISEQVSLEVTTRPGLVSMAVMLRSPSRITALKRWATVDAETLVGALRYAERVAHAATEMRT